MIYYTQTPDFYNDYIAHYGVKGMRWGHRKRQLIESGFTRRMARRQVHNEKMREKISNKKWDSSKKKEKLKKYQDITNNKYHVVTKRNGKSYIANESGKKISRGDYRDMEKGLKKSLKNSGDKNAYRDFKRAKKASKAQLGYIGTNKQVALAVMGANAMSSSGRKIANQKINTDIANYANKYLSDLRKKKRSK